MSSRSGTPHGPPPGSGDARGVLLHRHLHAAHELSALGKVVVLDIDYHRGNGTQEIFYRRSDVLTISIHGRPSFAYPCFSGFVEEQGEDAGVEAALQAVPQIVGRRIEARVFLLRAYPETRSVGPRPSESLSARAAREREPRKPRDFVRG